MSFTIIDSFIALAILITIIILSFFGSLFLIDIGFDTTFENYEITHCILLIVFSVIFVIIGMFFYDFWFTMRHN